jgi:hypothetical protein
MDLPSYNLIAQPDFLLFEFYSEGRKGLIKKRIRFSRVFAIAFDSPIYSISINDLDVFGNFINDRVVTNNGDMDKVLATVANAAAQFTDVYPEALIFARGSTASRTRLYRIQISRHIARLGQRFEIIGILESGRAERFTKDRPYEFFLARRLRLTNFE